MPIPKANATAAPVGFRYALPPPQTQRPASPSECVYGDGGYEEDAPSPRRVALRLFPAEAEVEVRITLSIRARKSPPAGSPIKAGAQAERASGQVERGQSRTRNWPQSYSAAKPSMESRRRRLTALVRNTSATSGGLTP